ncbi:MAG: hypothetical protein HC872_09630 [Gammaproteobacteria bacterium]|nr:hypothetical protein [Gammaproteobacteria bacterium]
MRFGQWKPYVRTATRRAQAKRAIVDATRGGQRLAPVSIEGRTIAKTFWGKAWCNNLEAYSDYENRLPRGRTYVRNGSVIDLRIEPGKVKAQVMGSSLYEIEIGIAAVPKPHWKVLTKECTGSIASLVELLQGRFSEPVMERICRPKTGLFPAPNEIQLKCSCPDWAAMCKHVAAVLYGVGARLDRQPDVLFTLRQVDATDLVTQAAELPMQLAPTSSQGKVLDDTVLADVFGIEMAIADTPVTRQKTETRRIKPAARAVVAPVKPVLVRKPAVKKKKAAKRRRLLRGRPRRQRRPGVPGEKHEVGGGGAVGHAAADSAGGRFVTFDQGIRATGVIGATKEHLIQLSG